MKAQMMTSLLLALVVPAATAQHHDTTKGHKDTSKSHHETATIVPAATAIPLHNPPQPQRPPIVTNSAPISHRPTQQHHDTSNDHRDTSNDGDHRGHHHDLYGSGFTSGFYSGYEPFYYYDSGSVFSQGNMSGVTYLGSSNPPAVVYEDAPNYSINQLTYVVPDNPAIWCGAIAVSVNADKGVYIQGEEVQLSINVDRNAYVYVYSTDSGGVTHQLLPNFYDRDNFMRRSQTLRLPSPAYGLRAVGSGWDEIRVIAVNTVGNWANPRPVVAYNANRPFLAFSDGVEGVRAIIHDELANDFRSQYGRVPGGGGVVVVPRERPLWGEASIRIFISEPVATPNPPADIPPPPPEAEQPTI